MLHCNNYLSPMMIHCIRTMTAGELPKYRSHLLRLDAEDRRLRFGFQTDDDQIDRHVRGIDLRKDRILVQVDDDLNVVAAVHMPRAIRAPSSSRSASISSGAAADWAASCSSRPFSGRAIGGCAKPSFTISLKTARCATWRARPA
jgi:hypothetical protein